jgi:hypothetical protein
MFDQYPPHPTFRSGRIAAAIGGLVVLLVLAALMSLFAMATPEPTGQIFGSRDFTQLVTPSEHTFASPSAHYQWNQ